MEYGYSNLSIARNYYEVAEVFFARLGETDERGRCLLGLAKIHTDLRQFGFAHEETIRALGLLQQTDNELGTANCLNFLGEIALEIPDPDYARKNVEAALEIYQRLDSTLGEANCRKHLARAALQLQDDSTATTEFSKALELFTQIDNPRGIADCLKGLGDAEREANPEAARALYRSALEIYQRIGDPLLIGRAHDDLAKVASQEEEQREHVVTAREAWDRIDRVDEELLRKEEDDLLDELKELPEAWFEELVFRLSATSAVPSRPAAQAIRAIELLKIERVREEGIAQLRAEILRLKGR